MFDYLAPILDLSTVTQSMALLSLDVQRETNSRSSREREAILPLHDICPSHLNHVTLMMFLSSFTGDDGPDQV